MRWHARGITAVRHQPVIASSVWKAVDNAAAKAARLHSRMGEARRRGQGRREVGKAQAGR
jgi:hypothetical protein